MKSSVTGVGCLVIALFVNAPPLEAGFASGVGYGVGVKPRVVAVGDFNKDGKLDIAVANQTDSTVSVRLGNGDGTFQANTDYASGGSNTISVVAGDFNGDGKIDLAAESNGTDNIGILIGNGGSTLKAIGRHARERLEGLMGRRVYLDTWVKVLPKWRRDPAALDRLGFLDLPAEGP